MTSPLGVRRGASSEHLHHPSPHALMASLSEFLRLQSAAMPRRRLARIFGVEPLLASARRAYAGARAEITLVDSLSKLGRGGSWTVLDGVSVHPDTPPVEHIVIGPPGVFSVALRNHSREQVWVGERTFVVDGSRLPHLTDVQNEADRVAEWMSAAAGRPVPVTPCLVVADPAAFDIREAPRRVEVFIPADFARWLTSLPRLLSPEAVDALRHSVLADDRVTAQRPVLADRAGFALVDRSITRARRIRLAWATIGAAL